MSAKKGSFQIIAQVDLSARFKHISHNNEVNSAVFVFSFLELEFMNSIKPGYQSVWILLQMSKIVAKNLPQEMKLRFTYSLQHILSII